MGERTDIVERLRDQGKDAFSRQYSLGMYKLCDEAADEIARLRSALESLTEDPSSTLDEPDEDWEVIVKMRAIAREALRASLPSEGR